jgi:hypothetical protein
VIREVEKVIYQGGGGEEDCNCLTGARLIDIWNNLFRISGP